MTNELITPISSEENQFTYMLALKSFKAIKKELTGKKIETILTENEKRAIVNRLLELLTNQTKNNK